MEQVLYEILELLRKMQGDNSSLIGIIQIVLGVITLLATIYIPEKIKWEQMYSSLIDSYKSLDYAIAYQGIVEFFATECKNNVENIPHFYLQHFNNEITKKKGDINKDNCLHFQRRMLAQFFWELNQCSNSRFIGKKRVMQDFTSSEAKLLKILVYIGEAIDNDETGTLYKSIATSAIMKKPEHLKGENKSLGQLYQVLSKSKRFMS